MSCILPDVANGVAFGGRGQHIVYLDLDYKFDIFRVSNLLQQRIESILRASRYDCSCDCCLVTLSLMG